MNEQQMQLKVKKLKVREWILECRKAWTERQIKNKINQNFDLQYEIETLQAQLSQGTKKLEKLEELNSNLDDKLIFISWEIKSLEEGYDLDLSNI